MDTEAFNILVIEEDKKTIKLLEDLSKETGNHRLNIKYSNSLEDLTDQLTSNQTDLLLINPKMNDGRGLNVFEFLRKDHIGLPILTIIHSNNIKDGLETLRLGAQDYIQRKNLNKETLFHSIVSSIERYKYTRPLIKAKENAEKSDELKTEFLAQVSHEIRTPINIITSSANHLREELSSLNISDDFKQSLRAIDKAGKRIIRTIDLILNMSEMLTGSYETQKHTMDLYLDILLDLFLRYRIYATRKNVELNIQKFTDDTEIKGDEYSINQIFLQLIDNAVKYTAKGKVEIRVKRDELNRLSVEIEDTGIGISEDFMQKIFEPFTQEMHGPRREFEGNGLGLALIKKYCELNNAEIAIESKKSVGTKFTITFSNQL